MTNKQTIFDIIYKCTGVSMAPCDMDEIIRLAQADIKKLVDDTPNNYKLGEKVRSYVNEK